MQVHFKGSNTIKTLLMAPKVRDNKLQKVGSYSGLTVQEYIGESGRSFGNRLREHLRAPSPIHQNSHSTGHPVSPKYFTIADREPQGVTRNIKEAMYICVNDP